MINLHVMNFDEHGMNSFIEMPQNGLERFLREWHFHSEQSINFYLHINDLNHLNQSITLEYISGNQVEKCYFNMIDFDDAKVVNDFFERIIKTFEIENVIFHYNTRSRLAYIQNVESVTTMMVLHDAMLFSESGGLSEDDDYERLEILSKTFSHVDCIIAVSNFMNQVVQKFYPEHIGKLSLIENDLYDVPFVRKKKQMRNEEGLTIVALGNITIPIKGSHILHKLAENDTKNNYHVLGRISDSEDAGLYKSIESYNFQDLPKKMLQLNPDIVLIPSMWDETFGFTALESTYMGYPVLCFEVGDLKRVEVNELGFVVKEKTYEAMFEMIRYLQLNKEEIEKINISIDQYITKKKTDFICQYEQKLTSNRKEIKFESIREHMYRINMEYGQDVYRQKVDYQQYMKERVVLENIVEHFKVEIQTYLVQLEDYHLLHITDTQKIQELESLIVAKKNEIQELIDMNVQVKDELQKTVDYRVREKIKKIHKIGRD